MLPPHGFCVIDVSTSLTQLLVLLLVHFTSQSTKHGAIYVVTLHFCNLINISTNVLNDSIVNVVYHKVVSFIIYFCIIYGAMALWAIV